MAEATIPVDLFNPGQVFACLGVVEAAEVLLGGAAGRFSWTQDIAEFTVRAEGVKHPLRSILEFLSTAKVVALRPSGSKLENGRRIQTREYSPAGSYPTRPPEKKAGLIALLETPDGQSLELNYWGKIDGRAKTKFWGGNRTAPDVAGKALRSIREVDTCDPFAFSALCEGVFRFDPQGSYLALDSGFSLDEHKSTITILGYPVTEILAALGLTHARPIIAEDKVRYQYTVVGDTPHLPPSFLRAMIGSSTSIIPGADTRRFEFFVGSPGASSQEYCITDVQELPEETRP